MAKFTLPITADYVAHWGIYECVREFIQNAKDEEEMSGHRMEVTFTEGEPHGTLSILNHGADFDRSALLLGKTTKRGRDVRGKFGEGLDLAILVAARMNLPLEIWTQNEKWTASIQPAPEYENAECLVVQTRKTPTRRPGVGIALGIPQEGWDIMKDLFLFLHPPDRNEAIQTDGGTVLLDELYAGRVYVKGLFVMKNDKQKFGYDLPKAEMDRDRRMVDTFDLHWRLGRILGDAATANPERMAPLVYDLLKEDAEETRLINHTATGSFRERIAEQFIEAFGDDAIPVGSIAESRELDHFGKKGVVVSNTLRDLVSPKLGSVSSIREELATQVIESHAWSDLDEEEQANLTRAAEFIDMGTKALGFSGPTILERTEVVTFRDETLHGLCNTGTRRIQLSRKDLGDFRATMETLVHEESHALTAASDGDHGHIAMVESLWSALFVHSL